MCIDVLIMIILYIIMIYDKKQACCDTVKVPYSVI